MDNHLELAPVFKALGDSTRLKIVELLSCGEMCACEILEYFKITQPTLSYHMKILIECGLVTGFKEGSWTHYANNKEKLELIHAFMGNVLEEQTDCICREREDDNICES